MSKGNPAWKVALTVLSLLLTVFVWAKGLQDSFNRPSVNPTLSLRQREMSVLAESAFPPALKSSFIGGDPVKDLRDSLRKIPLDEISDRNRILLANIETSKDRKKFLLNLSVKNKSFNEINSILNKFIDNNSKIIPDLKQIDILNNDPLLFLTSCTVIAGIDDFCIDSDLANYMFIRLLISQLFPILAILIGSILLIRQFWIFLRKKSIAWPKVVSLPLSLVDMTLLIAGGFVVLGEVLVPAIILPLIGPLIKGLGQPIEDSLKVLIGYSAMTFPPLLILRYQINGLRNVDLPKGGWLQWKLKPFTSAINKAIIGWLMVMPLVLLVGWLMNSFVGDQGGSNPLLELVLNSQDSLALVLLVLTTVVFAPLFEELVFRGALLPVLTRKFGSFGGIAISALVFAIAHLSVGELPPLFVLGLGLGVMRLSTGRLLPCVLMHSFWNGVTFFSLLLIGG